VNYPTKQVKLDQHTGRPHGEEGGRARAKLSQFYGLDDGHEGDKVGQGTVRKPSLKSAVKKLTPGSQSTPSNPYDINSAGFDADLFVAKLVSEASLSQLMAQEGEIVRQIQGLDSDMQTLVYENYNKFIAATETIRKMRVDFRSMEDEMEQLASSMSSITTFSSQISDKLRTRRQDVARLSSAHSTLQKLQFVLELPNKLTENIEEGRPGQAVEDWLRAERALTHYKDMASFAGIQEDCEKIMEQLKTSLREKLADPKCEGDQLGEAVELLRQLGTPSDELCDSYLEHCAAALEPHLQMLEVQANVLAGEVEDVNIIIMDPLEFVDEGCNKFLAELCLSATGFTNTFNNPCTGAIEQEAGKKLGTWVQELVTRYLSVMEKRLSQEKNQAECPILVRSLDRFHRRLTATSRLVPGLDMAKSGLDVVLAVSREFCKAASMQLEGKLHETMIDARQAIAQPRKGSETALNLQEISTAMLTAIADSVRNTFDTLQTFLDPELSFSVKTYFRTSFCISMVQEGVLIDHFHHIVSVCAKFSTMRSVPTALLLLLSRTCLDLHTSTTGYLASLLSEQFQLLDQANLTVVNTALANVSQALLDSYVQAQSAELSLMLRKSVEARDWLSTVEPRSVRAVMKRVVEDVTIIDEQVGQLYEEGQRKVRSSDSSRTFGGHRSRSVFSSYNSSNLDSSLASNIQKLFSEKIDYFAPVTPLKVSVLTGIIKLGLKTLLECVRLKTFGRYGLQQMQVDCHYLQLYLWRFVEDEAVVHHLLDEVLGSALHRSLEQPPQLMEPSVVEVICDKGG